MTQEPPKEFYRCLVITHAPNDGPPTYNFDYILTVIKIGNLEPEIIFDFFLEGTFYLLYKQKI